MIWYEEEVTQLLEKRDAIGYAPATIFYGSSTIRLWENLYNDFGPYKPVNLGFGGSTLAACVWFFERIVAPLQSAEKIIIYAGDNDLGDGRNPEEVLIFFQELSVKIRQYFPSVPCYFVSVKPSISRFYIIDKIKYTNTLIENEITHLDNFHFINVFNSMVEEDGFPRRELYEPDGLHLSPKGYEILKGILLTQCSFSQ